MIVTSFGLGIFLGFIFFELTGFTAGGIIVPGYMALFVQDPVRILVTLIVSIFTFAIVKFFSQWFVVFGRRRFLLMVLCGFMLRILSDHALPFLGGGAGIELRAIGYVIPGIIANEYARQGVVQTILSLSIVSGMVYLLLMLFYF